MLNLKNVKLLKLLEKFKSSQNKLFVESILNRQNSLLEMPDLKNVKLLQLLEKFTSSQNKLFVEGILNRQHSLLEIPDLKNVKLLQRYQTYVLKIFTLHLLISNSDYQTRVRN